MLTAMGAEKCFDSVWCLGVNTPPCNNSITVACRLHSCTVDLKWKNRASSWTVQQKPEASPTKATPGVSSVPNLVRKVGTDERLNWAQ